MLVSERQLPGCAQELSRLYNQAFDKSSGFCVPLLSSHPPHEIFDISMALRVPPEQIGHIQKFLELPDEKISGFLDALAKAKPQFNVSDLAAEISGPSQVPKPLAEGIVRVLASLYLTRDSGQPVETVEKFVDEGVYVALKRAQTFSQEDIKVQWSRLRKFLVAALSLELSVGTAAKAGPVLTQHERIFSGARILTDLRPIFHLNVSEKPDAAVIVHMLRITQRDNLGHRSNQYFALDHNDLVVMKELIERALKKEETLKEIMENSGVTVLDPKLFY